MILNIRLDYEYLNVGAVYTATNLGAQL